MSHHFLKIRYTHNTSAAKHIPSLNRGGQVNPKEVGIVLRAGFTSVDPHIEDFVQPFHIVVPVKLNLP